MKRLLALVLSAAMFFSLAAGCTPADQTDDGQTSPTADAGGEGGYTIATNNFGVGAYPLDMMVANEQSAADATGMTLTVTNNEFTADKVITQLQKSAGRQPRRGGLPGYLRDALPCGGAVLQERQNALCFLCLLSHR